MTNPSVVSPQRLFTYHSKEILMPEISLPSYSPFLKFLVICESPLSLAVPTHSILVAPKAMEDVLRIAIVSNENAYLEGGGVNLCT